MFCKTYSAGLIGVEGFVVEVETDISRGVPHCSLVGLPDSAVKESKERVRAAILNSGYQFPLGRLTVNLAPAHVKKVGAAFDLSVAVSILVASNQVQCPFLQETMFIGELSLDGTVKPVHGTLPMSLAAKQKGIRRIVVPRDNAWEAGLSGLDVYPIDHLQHLLSTLLTAPIVNELPLVQESHEHSQFPLIIGQFHAKRAMEIAAAGFHNILLIGPPGTGKTLLASALPFLLPPLSDKEMIELLSIHSACGTTLNANPYLSLNRPLRSPHHSITATGLIGGGSQMRPGEVTLAHHGVLYLDEMAEFGKQELNLLRQPIEQRTITLTRNTHHIIFPSRFMLVGSMNPCPCGFYGFPDKTHQCKCSSPTLERYFRRISGPLLDRFDLQLEIPRMDQEVFDSSVEITFDLLSTRKRILRAVKQQTERLKSTDRRNSDMSPEEVKKYCGLDPKTKSLLKNSCERLDMSHRAYHRILKVARTIADLNERESISEVDLTEAIFLRTMEKNFLSV